MWNRIVPSVAVTVGLLVAPTPILAQEGAAGPVMIEVAAADLASATS